MSTRLPDYRLKFLNKDTEERGEIGAAWLNEDGTITLVLDPKVYIGQDPAELLTLFPQAPKGRKGKPLTHHTADPAASQL